MHRIHTTRARAARTAVLAAAVALASLAVPAEAAPSGTSPRTSASLKPVAPATAATPQKQPAAVGAPATAPRPAVRVERAGRVEWIGGGIGMLSAFSVGSSVAVQADYGLLRSDLLPPGLRAFDLELHLIAGFARPTGNTALTAAVSPGFGLPAVQIGAGEEKLTALFFEVIPTGRILRNVGSGVAFFGDAGLGLASSFESYDRSEMFAGRSKHSEYATGFVLRLGAGIALDITPRWRAVVEPLLFDFMIGPKFSSWTPNLGVAYRR